MQARSPGSSLGARDPVDAAVVRDIERRLRAAVAKVCPASLAAERDDIVQQAMLRVIRILEQGEGAEPPGPSYLWKVAYTATIDQLRRMNSRAQLRERAAAAEGLSPGADPSGPSPEDAAAGREVGAAIRECLAGLLDARRRAVVLHLQGHSVPETGELLGWTRKRAENQVYRGLADLRRCLQTKGFER